MWKRPAYIFASYAVILFLMFLSAYAHRHWSETTAAAIVLAAIVVGFIDGQIRVMWDE